MKANTKYNLKCIFGSLISNDSAIASAKTLPWWAAIIAFCLGVFLPIIPVLVSNCNSYGSSNVVGVNYGLDRNVTEAMIDLHNKNASLIINEGSYLEYRVNGEVPATHDDTTPIGSYINTKENQYEFDIFYTARPIAGPDNADLFIKELGLRKYKVGTKELCPAEDTTSQVYTPSFIVFHNEEFYFPNPSINWIIP